MKNLLAALALTAAVIMPTAATAGSNQSCLQGVLFTNYGASSPSALRQCFQSKFTPDQARQAANGAGYYEVSSQDMTSVYKGDGSWLLMIKNRAGTYISEIILIMDTGI